jgi:hypothetical protein
MPIGKDDFGINVGPGTQVSVTQAYKAGEKPTITVKSGDHEQVLTVTQEPDGGLHVHLKLDS